MASAEHNVFKPTGSTAKVELFTTSATFSLPVKKDQQSLKFLLDSKKVVYEEFDVCSDQEKREEMFKRSGQRKLPQLFINGQFIGVSSTHCSPTKISSILFPIICFFFSQGYEEASYLEESGEFGKLLGSS